MLTSKAFSHRFNKLKLTNSSKIELDAELLLSLNMFLQGVLEVKALKQEQELITPLARMYGAIHRIKTRRRIHGSSDPSKYSDLNFYLILAKLESISIRVVTWLNLFYTSFNFKDELHLNESIASADRAINKLIFVSGYSLEQIQTEALKVYKPIAVHKGNKNLLRKKHLKKKLVEEATASSAGLLERFIKTMNLSQDTGLQTIAQSSLKKNE